MKEKEIRRPVAEDINGRVRIIVISLPIIIGVSILLGIYGADWLSFWTLYRKAPKGGFAGFIVGAFVEGFFQVIPFVVITLIIRHSIIKGAVRAEIFIKLAFMLLPISIVTTYWLHVHIDPFARGFLILINICLQLIGLLIGTVIYRSIYKQYGNSNKN